MLISWRLVERVFITWSFGALSNRQAGRFFFQFQESARGTLAQYFHEWFQAKHGCELLSLEYDSGSQMAQTPT
ncbi:MAG: hypothetical protein ROZ65_15910 [Pseudomonadaceae bacterium]|jgi:hypothetical protein|nr:hypothetical protein [Pseudomonadaceae bacterium]